MVLPFLLNIQMNGELVSIESFNPLPDDKILVWSKLKQVADDILKRI